MEVVKDTAFICKVVKQGQTSIVVSLFSQNHGIITGYFKGGAMKNKLSICMVGNLVEFTWKARVLSQLGTLEVNLLENFSTIFSLHKSSIVNSVCELTMILLQDNDAHTSIFYKMYELFNTLKKENDNLYAFQQYVLFENNFFSDIGFGYNFKECNISGEVPMFISPKTGNTVSQSVGTGYENRLFKIPLFILDSTITPIKEDLHKMMDINLHFLKLHIDTNKLCVRSFMLSLF